jgi:hypothetical protein
MSASSGHQRGNGREFRLSELGHVTEQIKAREPLFHHRKLAFSAETFDRETSDDFWEVDESVMGQDNR